jgi:7-cyano-7-deazaguanine synthase
MQKAVVLLSGGLDSATCLAVAKSKGFEPWALTILYGQRHEQEVAAARHVAEAMNVTHHECIHIPLRQFGGSALTDDIDVPKSGAISGEIPVTYVPARNTIFLSLALAYAETIGAQDIFIGVSSVDYSGYPDCRPEFIEAFQRMARMGTKAGVEGAEITIHAPLVQLSKAETIQLGMSLGVDYGLTHSCYDPVHGQPCCRCDSCRIRQKAFTVLGMADPALESVHG